MYSISNFSPLAYQVFHNFISRENSVFEIFFNRKFIINYINIINNILYFINIYINIFINIYIEFY